ncbi:MAG: hypothetical protein MZV70_20395 [Desulfobacterales bacterium]|nr:hypothetical protein [Desulfobacterales bacterium]
MSPVNMHPQKKSRRGRAGDRFKASLFFPFQLPAASFKLGDQPPHVRRHRGFERQRRTAGGVHEPDPPGVQHLPADIC